MLRWRPGRRTRLAILAGLGLCLSAAALDRLLPPDVSRYEQGGRLVQDRNGAPLRYLPTADGVWRLAVDPDRVDPQYIALLLAYEDQRFYSHPGIDPVAVGRALLSNLTAGRVVSGASTLTMQVARLLHPQRRGWTGKLAQAVRAVQLELRYSKREILSMYLTLAPFGGNIEGVHMASRLYFGKDPGTLSLAESALLIALPQSPTKRRPITRADAAGAGRDQVLQRLADAGLIDVTARQAAAAAPLPRQRQALPFLAPHLAAREARRAPAPAVIATTLDAGLQQQLEQLVRQDSAWFPDPAAMAVVVADVRTRRVLASISGADFDGPQGQVDLTRAMRSPGSTLKPFIYAMAMDQGLIHPETVIDDRQTRFGTYLPRNFDRNFQGRITIRDALQQSLNVPAVAVLERLGPSGFVAHLHGLGIPMLLPAGREEAGLAVALGGIGLALEDLVGLYAALADGGHYRPLLISSMPASRSEGVLVRGAAARQVTDILADAPRPSGIQGIANNHDDRIAYKTGTSYGFRDAWSVGYTAEHVVGVWIGRPDGTPRPGAYGRNTAAPAMFRIFDVIGGRGSDAMAATEPGRQLDGYGGARLPPPALRRFERRGAAAAEAEGPRILFPPPQVELALASRRDDTQRDAVVLEARGAALPLRWYVDGQPLVVAGEGRQVEWAPPGPGFFRISVVDAAGRGAVVRTRLVAPAD